MASEKEMYEIIGRSVADKKFRDALIANPGDTVKTLGYALTAEQIASLKDSDLGKITEELQVRVSKMGIGCGVAGMGAMGGPC